jgi:hypothetical protein
MSDNGNPFVVWMPGVLTRFGKRLRDLNIRHIRTQISTPWTNGKIEAFWEVLQSEVLDRRWFTSLAEAESALRSFADYYNFHRLSGTLGWRTPAERYLGVPFADRGFEQTHRCGGEFVPSGDARKCSAQVGENAGYLRAVGSSRGSA